VQQLPAVGGDDLRLAAHQMLARSALDPEVLASGRIELREPCLLVIGGSSARLRHYVQVFDTATVRLVDFRYATWHLDVDIVGDWTLADAAEVAAGDECALEFVNRGLRSDVALAVGPASGDRAAVLGVLAAYGLAADSGDAALVGELYTADALVEIAGDQIYRGRDSMEAMIAGPFHRSLLPWAGHTMGPALTWSDRNTATSVHVGRTYGPPPKGGATGEWKRRPFRYSVNRWELTRGGDGRWRVAHRVSHPAPGPQWRATLVEGKRAARAHARLAAAGPGAALDTVTAAAFAITGGDLIDDQWPFAERCRLTVDGRAMPADRMASYLTGKSSCAGVLPTEGVVIGTGDQTRVYNAVLTYAEDGPARVAPVRVDIARWTLNRQDGRWRVAEVVMAAGRSEAAAELLYEVAKTP